MYLKIRGIVLFHYLVQDLYELAFLIHPDERQFFLYLLILKASEVIQCLFMYGVDFWTDHDGRNFTIT